MRRFVRQFFAFLMIGLVAQSLAAKERDPDLFNTFYMEGTKPTWILTIKPKNLYSLIGPDGTYYEGWYNSSGEEIGFNYGNNANEPYRHFEYKLDDGNIKLNPTKKDMLNGGVAQGAMPPTKRGKSVKFISKQNWIADGKDEGPVNVVRSAPPPVVADNFPTAPAPQPQAPVIPIIPPDAPANPLPVNPVPVQTLPTIPQVPPALPPPAQDPVQNAAVLNALAGRYEFKPSAAVTETFSLTASGAFEYFDSQGSKASGRASVENGLLVLKSGPEMRVFQFDARNGLSLTRSSQDTPKFSNDLAYMSPSVGKTAQYTKQGAAGGAVAQVALQPQGPQPAPAVVPYDAETLKAVQAGQTGQALQQTVAALQANPADQRLGKQKMDLEVLVGVENLFGTLRGMYGQAQRAADASANPQDEFTAKLATYLKEHQAACDAGVAKARGLFGAGQSEGLPACIADAKNLGAESAEAFSKLSAYFAQKTATNPAAEVFKNLAEQAASLSQK